MEIRTGRLLLRELRRDDLERVLAYQTDPAYVRASGWPAPSADEVRALVERLAGFAEEVPRTKYQLAITLAATGELIGTCGLRGEEAQGEDEAEFGCELAPRFWGRGYAREASAAILAFGFETLGLRRIRARTRPENARAGKLALDLGFRPAGEAGEYERTQS